MQRMEVQQPWRDGIAAGRKTVEGRVRPLEHYASYVGEPLRVVCRGHPDVVVRVAAARWYPTLAAYLAGEGWQQTAPHAGSAAGAAAAYAAVALADGTPVFSPERVAARGGITALQLGPLTTHFDNEAGARVAAAAGPGPLGVRLAVSTPEAEVEWEVTRLEGERLRAAVQQFLEADGASSTAHFTNEHGNDIRVEVGAGPRGVALAIAGPVTKSGMALTRVEAGRLGALLSQFLLPPAE